jgi:hypothetical protein
VGSAPGLGRGRLFDAGAQVEEELLEAVLFGGLSEVVGRPVLLVGGPLGDGGGVNGRGLAAVVALLGVACRVDVLTRLPVQLEVLTGAGGVPGLEAYLVVALAGLRGDQSGSVGEGDLGSGRYLQALEFAEFHGRYFHGVRRVG